METKPVQQPKHPSDRYADEYIKTLAENGWQMHRAYTQGFNTGSIHVLVAQSQQLMKFAESDVCPDVTRPGIVECANYLRSIAQNQPYQFMARTDQPTAETVDKTGPTVRDLPKRGRRHRDIETNA